MKNNKKFLITSIILIAIGIVGLLAGGIVLSLTSYSRNVFKTDTGYTLGPRSRMGMMRRFNSGYQNKDLKNISFDQVKLAGEKYLNDSGLQNVKIKEIMEFSNNFYIETVEEDTGFGAVELLFDKTSGDIFPEYGPNMMWNQKYGMRSGFSGSQVNMTIDEQKAIEIAKSYLAEISQNEFAGDEGQKFYGYYTIDTVDKDGASVGMLSVNGFSAQIWYHSWHGAFIEMKEYE
ncbi:MAG: hypothetical protein ACYCXK_11765 [Candidatus Humimicrobiaceae bacterium]